MTAPVVVIDAANPVGRAVVEQALAVSRPVIAVTADPRAARRLRARQDESADRGAALTVIDGSIADEAAATTLADALRDLDRPLAGIVLATCGDPRRGRVLDQPADELQRSLQADQQPQLAAARALLPVLAAAVAMLVRVLHDEARRLGVRVQMLAVSRPVCTDDNREIACDGWPAAAQLATRALALVDQSDTRFPVSALVRFAEAS